MQIVFISNYLTHHQIPFCDEMYHRLAGGFLFIETELMTEERKKLGWDLGEISKPYVMNIHGECETEKDAMERINAADVVIIGGTEERYIYDRIRENKMIFRYEERIFKKSWLMLLNPHVLHMLHKCHYKNRKKEMYVLCASAYLSKEFRLLGLYKNRMLKWGYFPQTVSYDITGLMERKKQDIPELVWCARFIDWKHPEIVVKVAESLRKRQVKFHITMIGDGGLFAKIKDKIEKRGLQDNVSLTGAVPYTKVREYMEAANIFLATSDRNEGWGAVVNEAMNCGCAVVADRMMGSVPYLIEDGINGYSYADFDQCEQMVAGLIQNKEKCRELGRMAYKTIIESWNAEIAVNNLMAFIEGERKKGNAPGLMI